MRDFIEPIRSGKYEARLVKSDEELREYQALRYEHLILHYDPAQADCEAGKEERIDYNIGYDEGNSQLCVFYTNPETGKQEIVGGYLLMRFRKDDSFCKATLKYDLTKLFEKHKYEVLELGRAVTRPDHRNGVVLMLLWKGVEAYATAYNLRYLIGTTNFSEQNPELYRELYSYLNHNYLMAEDIMAEVLPECGYNPELIPYEELDKEAAIAQMPPLFKSYLKMGATVGKGLYDDKELKSIAVLTVLDMKNYGKNQTLK
jgi:putative hemolysin